MERRTGSNQVAYLPVSARGLLSAQRRVRNPIQAEEVLAVSRRRTQCRVWNRQPSSHRVTRAHMELCLVDIELKVHESLLQLDNKHSFCALVWNCA